METNGAFVSYSRKDSAFVKKLVNELKADGASVWLDQVDIQPGTPWDTAVQNALNTCLQMLLVLSPTAAASGNVLDEIGFALRTGKTILPILYQDCEIPLRVSRLQYIDFRENYAGALAELSQQLKTLQTKATPRPTPPQEARPVPEPAIMPPLAEPVQAPGPSARKKKSKRWIWITAGLVLIGAPVVYWATSRYRQGSQLSSDTQASSTITSTKDKKVVAKGTASPAIDQATIGVDLKLRALMGASEADVDAYLGSPDQWNPVGNKVLRYYWKRSVTVELDSPGGHVDSICFERAIAGPHGFSGRTGEVVARVWPGMTKSAIQSVLGSPIGGDPRYALFDSPELPGQTLEVDWGYSGDPDPEAASICISPK